MTKRRIKRSRDRSGRKPNKQVVKFARFCCLILPQIKRSIRVSLTLSLSHSLSLSFATKTEELLFGTNRACRSERYVIQLAKIAQRPRRILLSSLQLRYQTVDLVRHFRRKIILYNRPSQIKRLSHAISHDPTSLPNSSQVWHHRKDGCYWCWAPARSHWSPSSGNPTRSPWKAP